MRYPLTFGLLVGLACLVAFGGHRKIEYIEAEETASEEPPSPWTPRLSSNCTAWYDPSDDATITESSGDISAVADKCDDAGKSHTAFNLTAGGTPFHDAANDEIDIASGEYLTVTPTHSSTNHVLACGVFNISSPMSNNWGVIWGPASTTDPRNAGKFGPLLAWSSLTTIRNIEGYSPYATTGASAALGSLKVICSANDGGNGEIWIDGALTGESGTIGSDSNIAISFGHAGISTLWNIAFSFGNIAYFVGYDFSDDERQCVEGFLAHSAGLEGNLAMGHPYIASEPTTASTCIP